MADLSKRICDIHNHTLFGVDDGSRDLSQSLRMIELAKKEGIRDIILTPHYCKGRFHTDVGKIKQNYAQLKEQAKKVYPDITLYLGSEVFVDSEVLEEMRAQDLITMAGSKYLLLEFEIDSQFVGIKNTVMESIQCGYIPIVAHVERYYCLLKNIDRVYELSEMGASIQVNVSGITGSSGLDAKRFVRKLMKNQIVDFIATDAHGDERRRPHMESCISHVEKKYGQSYADKLFRENPARVIEDKSLEE